VVRILRAPLARGDLIAIWSLIADESSPATADAVLSRIYGAIELLAPTPHLGRARPEFHGAPRSLVVHPYVIFYQPLLDGEGIAIWRVLHGARRMDDLVRRPNGLE
jgi:plasmid stabilization system protein ParE